jgi:cell wall-associated NlpC family hydrolase
LKRIFLSILGGNMMSKTSKIAAVTVLAVGLVTTTVFANIKADNVYDDSTIGISSALDRYVESVTQEEALLNESLAADSEASDELTETAAEEVASSEEETTEADATEADTTEQAQTVKYPQFQDRCLTTVDNYVNIRKEADENSDLIGTLAAGGIALVKEKGDTWTYIASGSCEGYIKNEYLVFGDDAGEFAETHLDKLATINTETLKVREEADEDSACLTMVPGGEEYAILSEDGDWVKIEVDESVEGYVSAEYITTSFQVVRAVSVEEAEAKRKAEEAAAQAAAEAAAKAAEEAAAAANQSSNDNSSSDSGKSSSDGSSKSGSDSSSKSSSDSSNSTSDSSSSDNSTSTVTVTSDGSTGSAVAAYAVQFVGNPYVWGGTSLTNGADCSGFTLSVYAHFGYSLPHSSSSQANCGTEVSLSALQPGDLIFYNNGGSIGHVALYIGNGQVVHASSAKTGIKISAYNYRTPAKAVRILN